MILPFSTKLNGQPTYFVEKILTGLMSKKLITEKDIYGGLINEENPLVVALVSKVDDKTFNLKIEQKYVFDFSINHNPKLHTIRDDKNDRWQPGVKIDFFINARTKKMFRFAPVLPVVSTQLIEIKFSEFLNDAIIKIDGRKLTIEEQQQLAWNDGFNNLLEFLLYFKEDFTGKLIHWTDLRY